MSPDCYRVTLIGGPTEYWQAEKSSIVYDPSAPPMPKDPSPKVSDISAQRSLYFHLKSNGKLYILNEKNRVPSDIGKP